MTTSSYQPKLHHDYLLQHSIKSILLLNISFFSQTLILSHVQHRIALDLLTQVITENSVLFVNSYIAPNV